MSGFGAILKGVGRLSLALALNSSILITNAVGEGLVLHEHGLRRIHLHIVGQYDSLADAAASPRFGHGFDSRLPRASAAEPVHVLAILKIASKFGWAPDVEGKDQSSCACASDSRSVMTPESLGTISTAMFSPVSSTWPDSDDPISIVLRYHTLLI